MPRRRRLAARTASHNDRDSSVWLVRWQPARKGLNDAGVVIPLIVYSLTNVVISSVSVGGGGGDKPIENFSLNYASIKWDFSTQKEAGGKEGTVQGKWDISTNKAA